MDEDAMSRTPIYPDPEDVPRYPWLGDHGIDIHSFGQQPISRNAVQVLAEEETHSRLDINGRNPWNQSISDSDGDGEIDGEIDGNTPAAYYDYDSRVLVRPDINNSFEDPDFEICDEDYRSDEHMSEADSDELDEAQLFPHFDMRRAKSSRGRGKGRGRGTRGRGNRGHGRGMRGLKRGLRRPLEPGLDFKALHSQATMAFVNQDYDEAEQLVQQAIFVNPEMFSAHSLLSEIHQARGEHDKATTALFNGAHTRPRDIELWSKVAELVLERAGADRHTNLRTALYCYSRVINVDQDNIEARLQRASLNQELGYKGKAGREYERILTHLPYDTDVLRHLAEIYSETNDVERVLQYYDKCIAHYRITEPREAISFTWSDVNIYAELHGFLENFEDGISNIKKLARWLLGRSDDAIWDGFHINDCEWDAEDQPRRAEVAGFAPSQHSLATYGDGLPLELRIKLGVYRLKMPEGDLEEALNHFEWLDPENEGPDAKLYDYPDLFREAGDSLRSKSYHSEALRYYEPLQRVDDYADPIYYFDMAACYRSLGMTDEAEDCYHMVIENDKTNFDARIHLAKFYEELGMAERASIYANEAVILERTETVQNRKEYLADRALALGSSSTGMVLGSGPFPRTQRRTTEKVISEQAKEDNMRLLFKHLQTLTAPFNASDEEAKQDWMSTANELIKDFRSHKAFYPTDQHVKFPGISNEAQYQAKQKEFETDSAEALSGQLRGEPFASVNTLNTADGVKHFTDEDQGNIPRDYRGTSIDAWLDLFLVYAFTLAQDGNISVAYEVMSAASESIVFLRSADSIFSIQVCWFTCALMANDEETLVNSARWFMKEYQFVTDAYRLFAALNRLCDNSNLRYNFGPSQKFILRQIKAMDFHLGSDNVQKAAAHERASLTLKDKNGNPIPPENMDIALIMLYGHVLYAGTSYSYAIAYFLRAYALDPTNPMINLSLALAYIHYALKRQSSNRHHLITQGFAFLFEYYDIRRRSIHPSERQEAAYNVGRAYHLLGLNHLAIPYYEDCLALSPDVRAAGPTTIEDFATEAAFALQELWALSGDVGFANAVTKAWLVI